MHALCKTWSLLIWYLIIWFWTDIYSPKVVKLLMKPKSNWWPFWHNKDTTFVKSHKHQAMASILQPFIKDDEISIWVKNPYDFYNTHNTPCLSTTVHMPMLRYNWYKYQTVIIYYCQYWSEWFAFSYHRTWTTPSLTTMWPPPTTHTWQGTSLPGSPPWSSTVR